MNDIKELKRGDRFITRQGRFGDQVHDYFVLDVSEPFQAIKATYAGMSGELVAPPRDLENYERENARSSYNTIYTVFELNGRWYVDWEKKEGKPDLLEAVELPIHCTLCDGVRGVSWLHGEPLCLDCRPKILDDRICDCALRGQHIMVVCDRCGSAHSTKNISHIGARHVHPIYEDSCGCGDGWFFHDCRGVRFVKGQIVEGKFVKWVDKYKEGK